MCIFVSITYIFNVHSLYTFFKFSTEIRNLLDFEILHDPPQPFSPTFCPRFARCILRFVFVLLSLRDELWNMHTSTCKLVVGGDVHKRGNLVSKVAFYLCISANFRYLRNKMFTRSVRVSIKRWNVTSFCNDRPIRWKFICKNFIAARAQLPLPSSSRFFDLY